MEFAKSKVRYMFDSLRNFWFSKVKKTILHFHKQCMSFSCSTFSPTFSVANLFNFIFCFYLKKLNKTLNSIHFSLWHVIFRINTRLISLFFHLCNFIDNLSVGWEWYSIWQLSHKANKFPDLSFSLLSSSLFLSLSPTHTHAHTHMPISKIQDRMWYMFQKR